MKYLALLLLVVVTATACRQRVKGKNGIVYKNAVEYNDYVIGRQTSIIQNVMDFLKVSDTNLDSAKTLLNVYSIKVEGMVSDIKGMPPYKGDSVLRDAAIGLFRFYKRIFTNEYKQIIDIRLRGGNETEDGVAEMKRIVSRITTEEEKYDKAFHNAQSDFASKNNMKPAENEMQKKIDKATGN